ncbi:hypothetical protein [Burkholderia stabilis]|uniref:hypothetical protein n=1 Tax=Burkholderia stabilis TaxID=95485 RepID=UPI001F4B6AC1|nr:hypothetical protein [Burkholderia stabilis]
MTTLFVQFTDSKESKIAAVFSCPQDEEAYLNQGEIESSDERYAAYYAALPASVQSNLAAPD